MTRFAGVSQARAGSVARALVLAVIAFSTAELISGASTAGRLEGLAPTFLLYGGGVVLIREVARRGGIGLGGMAVMGIAYALLEEGLTMQSLFNPTVFGAATHGGRAFGVNWVWATWAIGYHGWDGSGSGCAWAQRLWSAPISAPTSSSADLRPALSCWRRRLWPWLLF
jgi:hypothetical protein